MANTPRRKQQLKARLARQRPSKVRTRERKQEVEQGNSAPSQLVKIGAVITIVASIAGLITTGVATLFGALVADDQLKQSQHVADEKKREQAARVSYWVNVEPGGTSRLHLTNRSPDPVANLDVTFTVRLRGLPATLPLEKRRVSFAVGVPSLPPCSDLVLTPHDMRYREGLSREAVFLGLYEKPPSGGKWSSFKGHPWISIYTADFTDHNGVRWRRLSDGVLAVVEERPDRPRGLPGVVLTVPPQPLKSCGS
ncbi:hypothetical protein [Streptomyces sp. NRRL S-87]|uniref:hypothetical protein n=1 Tax=Streptomyces sp. NRRL S-87 TaxID=1463920 RepID=UPI00131A776D|nr:hypothetical protein [Streptomyces sp. NRRL S-87]